MLDMGRPATSLTREKQKTSFYLSEEAKRDVERCYIEVLHSLRRHADKTRFIDALVKVALKHREEIVQLMEETR